ncbi:hypothetical protein CARUB_v10015474mg [Capsella rubella]|uniref:Uncharacterized protein n=1 Tax=Capsella rubella TaxID=81985 RepID=R0HW64_9BRAS|nr:hypothetical protein CARUB_v10015474mg [Capsella rubella]
MAPNNNMRSVITQGAMFLLQGTGATLGCILGYYCYGGKIDKYEKQRQQIVMDVFRDPAEVEDLREKMWPELRKITWFRNMEKNWSESDLKKNMELVDSDVRKNVKTVCAKLIDEKMWSDVWQKMFSDRKS